MKVVTIDIGHDHSNGMWSAPHVEAQVSYLLTKAGFDGHTITHGTGYWRGDREGQTTARVYLTSGSTIEDALAALRETAGKIRDTLQQDAVGFMVQDATVDFV